MQKTAYEMRISDWSSDVCSSDLAVAHPDLEDALDVHLGHVGLGQAVLRPEQLLEDRVVEGLGAQQADVEDDRLADLADLAAPHGQIGRASCRERVCQYV